MFYVTAMFLIFYMAALSLPHFLRQLINIDKVITERSRGRDDLKDKPRRICGLTEPAKDPNILGKVSNCLSGCLFLVFMLMMSSLVYLS